MGTDTWLCTVQVLSVGKLYRCNCTDFWLCTVQVLSVGKLYPPNITYSYIVSAGDNVRFKWSNMGAWRKCSRICKGNACTVYVKYILQSHLQR